jgi:hypothetical protein
VPAEPLETLRLARGRALHEVPGVREGVGRLVDAHAGEAARDHLVAVVAEHLARGVVDVHHLAGVDVVHPHAVGGVLEDGAIAGLARPQRVLRRAAIADVAPGHEQAVDAVDAHAPLPHLVPDDRAVLVPPAPLEALRLAGDGAVRVLPRALQRAPRLGHEQPSRPIVFCSSAE